MAKKKNRKKRSKLVLPRRSKAHQELVLKLRFGNAAARQVPASDKGTRAEKDKRAIDDHQ